MGKKKAKVAVASGRRGSRGSFIELALKKILVIEGAGKYYVRRLTGVDEGAGFLDAVTNLLDHCEKVRDEVRKLSPDFSPKKKVVQGIVFVPKMPVAIKAQYIKIYEECVGKKSELKDLHVKSIAGEGRGAKIIVRIGADGDRILGAIPKGHLQTVA